MGSRQERLARVRELLDRVEMPDRYLYSRAHPTGLMGAMGLDGVAGYVSRQAAVGGEPDAGRHVRLYVEGGLASAARLVRRAAVEAGGTDHV